jgi:hypothetical protein
MATAASWSPLSKVISNTAIRDALASGAGDTYVEFYTLAGLLLATVTLNPGVVDGATGVTTYSQKARDDAADNSGDMEHGKIFDGDGNLFRTMPVIQGTTAVPNYFVINSTTIIQGGPIEIQNVIIR